MRVSAIGPLSELPDIEFIRQDHIGEPANSLPAPPEREGNGPTFRGAVSRTSTDAPLWHGAQLWHDADPPLTGDGVNVGVIDIGFNGFRSLQGGDKDLPPVSEVTSYCAFADSVPEGRQNTCELPLAPTPRNSSTPTATPHSGWHGTAVSEAIMDIAPDARLSASSRDLLVAIS